MKQYEVIPLIPENVGETHYLLGLKHGVYEVMPHGKYVVVLCYGEEMAHHICALLNADTKKRGEHETHTDKT